MSERMRYVVITPARDDAAHLRALGECLLSQTAPPELWLVADDGSTDDTARAVADFARRAAFVVHHRVPQRDAESAALPGAVRATAADLGPAAAAYAPRIAAGAVPRAFNSALGRVDAGWDAIVKLDADLTFGDDYFERLLERFAQDPKLGIAGGHCFERRGDDLRLEWVPDTHVRGATKMYRRECFDDIGGIEEVLGWDGIDEIRAQMRGWSTCSFGDLPVHHHRSTGSRGGKLRGRVRGGRCNYFLGYGPAFMLARAARRMAEPPYVIGGLALLWGYIKAWLAGEERYEDKEFRQYLRATQRRRLTHLFGELPHPGR